MAKLDPGAKFVAARSPATLARLSEQSVFNVAQQVDEVAVATVFVRFTGDVSTVERAGMRVHSVAGDIATGEVQVDQLETLAQLDSVVRVELSRVLHHEMDLGLPEAGVPAVHAGPPGLRGAGVIVGIVDPGIDYLHSAFRRDDGTSRILAIWDQGLEPQGIETSPAGFGYGVEYRKPAIDEAIASDKPFDLVRHRDQAIRDVGCHGTHVAGIAAGDGLAAGPARTDRVFTGVAPAADIVVVANTRGRAAGELGLGDSAASLDAVRYIFRAASYANRGGAPGTLSAFSSRGPTRDGRPAPTVAAPGEFVMSAQPSPFRNAYGLMSGTSMASPVVAGIVTLLLQKQSAPRSARSPVTDEAG
ncbi:MAG TPA: S8 family serine peptidase [Micromonosporaceae bacterium]|nr:S8 family serine peptidase [Micromonosporaceae bacterium]